jgi:hypothetical protein
MKVILVLYVLSAIILGVGFIYCANSIGHSETKQAPIKKEQTVHQKLTKVKNRF